MPMSNVSQLCTFWVNGLYFGIDALRVQEVIRTLPVTWVPLAPPEVEGLINLRGRIVAAVDLRRRIGLPARPEGREPMNVVIESDDGAISLLVDEIGDVIEVDETHLERPPETLAAGARELIRGVHKLPDRLLLVLDTDRTVSFETLSMK